MILLLLLVLVHDIHIHTDSHKFTPISFPIISREAHFILSRVTGFATTAVSFQKDPSSILKKSLHTSPCSQSANEKPPDDEDSDFDPDKDGSDISMRSDTSAR
jgi:hypothetical protein